MPDIALPITPTAPGRKGHANAAVKVWDLPTRLFHWLLAATVLLAFVSAEEGTGLAPWHVAAGWVAAILIGFRMIWGFIGGQHARFRNFIRPGAVGDHVAGLLHGRVEPSLGHNPLGGLATLVLLATVTAVVWSGASLIGGTGSEDLHEGLAGGLLALVGLHVAAVVVMSVLSRENLVRAMVTGVKPRARHPGAVDAAPAAGLAAPAAALAIIAGAYAVQQVDSGAFVPGSHAEAGETEDADHD
ncbi:cytochrome b/b6 domain-containing protein [Polymorphobacter fuscus]|uniref:Cytochrome B n=1 Tax=Sandarakinorhabdus fusca TaxID=1439888 RepID=A0A7C9GRQ5_9SPHN|nr:cytochrome b/b6 domain-containing protein [Polymorphobacter fuscus]KAB7643875.1 cytochrome B [Polymorphobacter fuscus]MQT18576.1 cytochrome B [Polymorphobacter fuscus]NJC07057.1 cytochrome b [Polymorphobacter fuscus]